LITSQSRVYAQ